MQRNVRFLGYLPNHEEALAVIAKSKILCLASVAEGFGIVAIESAALQVPTVLSDIPVLREVTLNGAGGLLFRQKDIKDLAKKIQWLLENKSMYAEKKLKSRVLAQKYDWELISRQTENIYNRILES